MEDYSVKEPKLGGKSGTDASAYKSDMGAGAGKASKGAKLDSAGGVSKKEESVYKEGCKSE